MLGDHGKYEVSRCIPVHLRVVITFRKINERRKNGIGRSEEKEDFEKKLLIEHDLRSIIRVEDPCVGFF